MRDCYRSKPLDYFCKVRNAYKTVCSGYINLFKVNYVTSVFGTQHYVYSIIFAVLSVNCAGSSFYAGVYFICNSVNVNAKVVGTLAVYFYFYLRKSFVCVYGRFAYVRNAAHYVRHFFCNLKCIVQTGRTDCNVKIVSCHLSAHSLSKRECYIGKVGKMFSELILNCNIIVYLFVTFGKLNLNGAAVRRTASSARTYSCNKSFVTFNFGLDNMLELFYNCCSFVKRCSDRKSHFYGNAVIVSTRHHVNAHSRNKHKACNKCRCTYNYSYCPVVKSGF